MHAKSLGTRRIGDRKYFGCCCDRLLQPVPQVTLRRPSPRFVRGKRVAFGRVAATIMWPSAPGAIHPDDGPGPCPDSRLATCSLLNMPHQDRPVYRPPSLPFLGNLHNTAFGCMLTTGPAELAAP